MKVVVNGFKFGMLLQLAIGPICLYVFKTAGTMGFSAAMSGVAAVVLVDSLFILLAILGIASFVGKEKVKKVFTFVGAVIVGLFGLATILGVLGIGLIPTLGLSEPAKGAGTFAQAFLLTLANPLTILFWAGVFSTKLAEGALNGREVYHFGLGSALSTLISLTIVAGAGTLTGTFLPPLAIKALNILIGLVLIYFAVRMIARKDGKAVETVQGSDQQC